MALTATPVSETASGEGFEGFRVPARAETFSALAACVIGAGTALSGFPPLNDVGAILHVGALPGFALLMPAGLLAVLTLWMSRGRADAGRVPVPAVLGIGLLCLGGLLSLSASRDVAASTAELILGMLAPACIFLGVRRGRLAPTLLAGSFLAALTAALLWADVVFLRQNGIPTPAKLFNAKFSDHAHDFHYYTLGNPDHTATFLLLPLALCLVWLRDRDLSRRRRQLLLGAAAVILVTIVLLYVRLPMVAAFAMVAAAISVSRLSRRIRVGILVGMVAAAVGLALASPSNYLTHLFSPSSSSSARVRIDSISAGLRTLGDHLLTGVGLGQYGLRSGVPAHSSVVQAGAELGVAGFLGLLVVTIALAVAAVVALRQRHQSPLAKGALAGSAVYVLAAAVSAGADDALFVGLVSIYGLTLALFAGVGLAPSPHAPRASAIADVRGDLSIALQRLRARGRALVAKPRLAWLVYGLMWAPVAVLVTAARVPSHGLLTSVRQHDMALLLAAHQKGFGPLVELTGVHSFAPAGLTDDPGGYLVIPWLSGLLHTADPDSIIRSLFLFGIGVLVAAYPLAIRRLTGSRLAAVVAPLLVLVFFGFMTDSGFYWLPAVPLAVSLPWLLTFMKERSAPLLPLTVIAAAAGMTQLFRSGMGLGILAGAIAVALVAPVARSRRAVAVLLLALAFYGFSTGVLDLALQARAGRMQAYPLATNGYAGVTKWSDPGGHPFWHTVYIGLGVIPNRYGITYNDSAAAAYVRSVDPAAAYVGPRYEAILRRRVLHILTADPGFVLRAELQKVREVMTTALNDFWPLILLIPTSFALGMGATRRRRYAAVILPAGLIAVLPPLVAVPLSQYELPWLAFLATGAVLCAAWLVRAAAIRAGNAIALLQRHPHYPQMLAARDWVTRKQIAGTAGLRRVRRAITLPPRAAARGAVAVTRGTALGIAGFGPVVSDLHLTRKVRELSRSRGLYVVMVVIGAGLGARAYLNGSPSTLSPNVTPPPATPVLPFNAPLPPAVHEWSLDLMPAGWTADPGTRVHFGRAMQVVTTSRNNAYQVQSAAVRLPAGKYIAAVRGELRTGGMELGVLNVHADRWIMLKDFEAPHPASSATMTVDYTNPTSQPVEIILSNFSPPDASSAWRLSQVLITRQGRPLRPSVSSRRRRHRQVPTHGNAAPLVIGTTHR